MLHQQLACRDRHSSYHTHTIRRLAHIFPCKDCSLLLFLLILLLRCLPSPLLPFPPLRPRLHHPLHPALSRPTRRRLSAPRHPRTAPAPGPETPPSQSRAGSGSRDHRPAPEGWGTRPRSPVRRSAAAAQPLAPGPVRGPATAPSAAGPARGGGGGEGGGEAAECAASRGIERAEQRTGRAGEGPGPARLGALASPPRRDRGRVALGRPPPAGPAPMCSRQPRRAASTPGVSVSSPSLPGTAPAPILALLHPSPLLLLPDTGSPALLAPLNPLPLTDPLHALPFSNPCPPSLLVRCIPCMTPDPRAFRTSFPSPTPPHPAQPHPLHPRTPFPSCVPFPRSDTQPDRIPCPLHRTL